MAIAEDASTPATLSSTAGSATVTTASFSPPAASLLLAIGCGGFASSGTPTVAFSDSTSGSYTTGVTSSALSATCVISYRYLSAAPGSMTVSCVFGNLTGDRWFSVRVLTGADSAQTGAHTGAKTTGTTTAGTFAVTKAAGSAVYGVSCNNGASSGLTLTANGATTLLTGALNDSPNGTAITGWHDNNDATSGAVTYGGTWTLAGSNIGNALEILAATGVSGPEPGRFLLA